MPSQLNQQSEIVARYIDAADERTREGLIELDWLDRALVRVVKMNTSVATMRLTVHWVSCGRQHVSDIKEHCEKWLKLRYKVGDCEFRQSQDEQRSSTPLATYFHCICVIPDAVNGKR